MAIGPAISSQRSAGLQSYGEYGMTDRYPYRVTWSVDDEEYVGLCAEFPSLSWLAPTADEAFSGIRQRVADSLADMQAANDTAPEPMADRSL